MIYTALASTLILFAAPAQQSPTPKPADLCSVQGVVVKAGTDEPIRKAIVEAQPANPTSQPMVAVTDAMGRFELKDLQPGSFRLSARRNGFVLMQFGQRTRLDRSGLTLTLVTGQKISDVTLKLTPTGVISGHVYDEEGEPVMRAEIGVTPYPILNWQQQLENSDPTQTNDLGEFRIFGLPPGQYVVQLSIPPDSSIHAPPKQGYLPVFYPGFPDSTQATPITLHGGDEFSGVDFTVRPARTVTVKGQVFTGKCGGGSRLLVVSLQGRGSDLYSLGRAVIRDENGQVTFEFPSVPAGSYYLRGWKMGEDSPCSGRQPLEVADADVDGLGLALLSGVDIRGRVRVQGKPDFQISNLGIALFPKGAEPPFGDIYIVPPKADGSFVLQNIFDGEHEITLSNMPENYFLQSARLDGVDVLGGVTVDTRQAVGTLDLLLSPNGAILEGVVSKDQQPFQGATVALVPDPPHRGVKRLYKSASTDQNGHFTLQGIAPGDYQAFAWEKFYPEALTSPEVLAPYEKLGQSIHVIEGEHNSMNLDLIPTKDSSQ